MSVFTAAFHSVMNSDAILTSALRTFNNRPAIFTYEPVPKNVEFPYIITVGEVGNLSFDTKTTRGREITRDIRCYAEATGDAITLETIAERVRALFHRVDISVTGFKIINSEVAGPITIDDNDAYGRVLTVTLLLDET